MKAKIQAGLPPWLKDVYKEWLGSEEQRSMKATWLFYFTLGNFDFRVGISPTHP
jgi:hypothetical protein